MKSILLSCFALVCSFSVLAADEIKDPSTGATFPTEVTFDYQGKNYQLETTGVSTRKKLVFKVYSVAHYLQKGVAEGKDKLGEILNDANAKQLTIKWVRDVPADKVQSGYEESLKGAIPEAAYAKLQTPAKTFIDLFNHDVTNGEEHVIRWIPGGTIEVLINGKPAGTITNPEFAKGLWNIWFGSKSVVNRDNLLTR